MEGFLRVDQKNTWFWGTLQRTSLHLGQSPLSDPKSLNWNKAITKKDEMDVQFHSISEVSTHASDANTMIIKFRDRRGLIVSAKNAKEKEAWMDTFLQLIRPHTLNNPNKMADEFVISQRIGRSINALLDAILIKGAESEGVFRLSCGAEQKRALFHQLVVEKKFTIDPETDINVIACLLKQMLRSLPQTLLTERLFQQFIDAAIAKDVPKLETLIHSGIPSPYRALLAKLFRDCVYLNKYESVTKMNSENLGKTLGVSLLIEENMDSLRNIKDTVPHLFDIMMSQYNTIFRIDIETEQIASDESSDEDDLLSVNASVYTKMTPMNRDRTKPRVKPIIKKDTSPSSNSNAEPKAQPTTRGFVLKDSSEEEEEESSSSEEEEEEVLFKTKSFKPKQQTPSKKKNSPSKSITIINKKDEVAQSSSSSSSSEEEESSEESSSEEEMYPKSPEKKKTDSAIKSRALTFSDHDSDDSDDSSSEDDEPYVYPAKHTINTNNKLSPEKNNKKTPISQQKQTPTKSKRKSPYKNKVLRIESEPVRGHQFNDNDDDDDESYMEHKKPAAFERVQTAPYHQNQVHDYTNMPLENLKLLKRAIHVAVASNTKEQRKMLTLAEIFRDASAAERKSKGLNRMWATASKGLRASERARETMLAFLETNIRQQIPVLLERTRGHQELLKTRNRHVEKLIKRSTTLEEGGANSERMATKVELTRAKSLKSHEELNDQSYDFQIERLTKMKTMMNTFLKTQVHYHAKRVEALTEMYQEVVKVDATEDAAELYQAMQRLDYRGKV